MESKTIPLSTIRGLLIAQEGRCAITGEFLNPQEVNGDHITPLSRKTLNPSYGADNLWLVTKKINAMKGTLTYDELVEMAKLILENQERARRLLKMINANNVQSVSKEEFDNWIADKCDEDGCFTEK